MRRASDYLSRLEVDLKEKLVLKSRQNVETRPIEVNVQSAGVSEEEQIFFTGDDDETEAHIWERKNESRNYPIYQEVVIQTDLLSENIVDEITIFNQKLRRINQIRLEHSKILSYTTKSQNSERRLL